MFAPGWGLSVYTGSISRRPCCRNRRRCFLTLYDTVIQCVHVVCLQPAG